MVTLKYKARVQSSWPLWRWILTSVNVLGLVLSVTLSWHFLEGGSIVGCGGGSSCDQVLNSRWSMVAGVIPISGLAVGVYLTTLVASLFIGSNTEAQIRQLAWNSMLILVGSIAGSAIWFTIVQKWVIGKFCTYCMTTHITGVLLSALVIWRATKEFDNHPNDIPNANSATDQNVSPANPRCIFRPLRTMGMALIGLVLAGILATCQVGFNSLAVYRNGESQNNLPVLDYHTGTDRRVSRCPIHCHIAL